jgi:hypothetical protein
MSTRKSSKTERSMVRNMPEKTVPNPGSDEAVKLGCKCPIVENNLGKGMGNGLFWIEKTCPIHGHMTIVSGANILKGYPESKDCYGMFNAESRKCCMCDFWWECQYKTYDERY